MLPHQFFKLLSDETRVRSLLLICHQGALCVAEITAALNESQPKISRHLAQLRSSGVLHDERRGQWVYYQLAQDLPGWMNKLIEDLKDSQCLQKQYQEDIHRLTAINRNECCITKEITS